MLFVNEIQRLVEEHKVGFFILADEEPTINRKKFIALCDELIKRNLPVQWGINTRVTDILRDEALLPLYRKAGLIHVSLGTEAAEQALKTGEPVELKPMSAFERKIVHDAVAAAGATSTSKGEEPNRRIVVQPS